MLPSIIGGSGSAFGAQAAGLLLAEAAISSMVALAIRSRMSAASVRVSSARMRQFRAAA